ncbi:GspE/PulE family protein [Vibrio sp. THAF190c]|uniref:GspE/PulE family protein n=1 Tax=Vibrio sp. THAF190c TaxID=2587865 RepID=UPI00126846F0|nr:ATPase, T2SS/T4P/T4SS family [Vibrio sp. THAF190c]QFT13396.1 Type II secretion system protein E [Vibrio sp. THAF190c]
MEAKTIDYVEGICKDEKLRDLICESETCYINNDGYLCGYKNENEFDYSDIEKAVKNSEKAFDGVFYGVQPKFILVSETEVRDAVLKIKSISSTSVESEKALSDSDAKLRLQRVLEQAIANGASDVHIRLSNKHGTSELSQRKDGEFIDLMPNQTLKYGEELCRYAATAIGGQQAFSMETQVDATFEIMLDVSEVDSKGSKVTLSKTTKWRLSQIKIDDGSKVTIRALQIGAEKILTLKQLGLSKGHIDAFVKIVNSAQGALLMSGPTGSGKTTTINAGLSTIKSTKVVHSLEDPVEFLRQGKNNFSTAVNEDFTDKKTKKKTKSFQHYGKVLLRHDTNCLYFGEVRDKEAAAIFMRLATTGQVMVGTIHCNSAISIITTIAEQLGVPVSQLAAPGIIKGLAHQRLVRTLCPDCKIPHEKANEYFDRDSSLEQAYEDVEKMRLQQDVDVSGVYYRNSHSNCTTCKGSGEKGRTALFELILVDAKAREFIRELKLNEWLEHLKEQGFPSLRDHAQSKLTSGVLDYRSIIEEVDGLVEEKVEHSYQQMRVME